MQTDTYLDEEMADISFLKRVIVPFYPIKFLRNSQGQSANDIFILMPQSDIIYFKKDGAIDALPKMGSRYGDHIY